MEQERQFRAAIGQLPNALLVLLDQLCDLEQKVENLPQGDGLRRNIGRMKDALAEMNLRYENPLGQRFSETRTDVEAHIAGAGTEDLEIVEVLKPIIRYQFAGESRVIRKGVVIVQSRNPRDRE